MSIYIRMGSSELRTVSPDTDTDTDTGLHMAVVSFLLSRSSQPIRPHRVLAWNNSHGTHARTYARTKSRYLSVSQNPQPSEFFNLNKSVSYSRTGIRRVLYSSTRHNSQLRFGKPTNLRFVNPMDAGCLSSTDGM